MPIDRFSGQWIPTRPFEPDVRRWVTAEEAVQAALHPHPFVYARERFLAGQILVEQAIQLAMTDSEFQHEAVIGGQFKNVRDAAEKVVRDIWAKELIKIIQQRKAINNETQSVP